MSGSKQQPPSVTVRSLRQMKQASQKIVCLTAYDASFARLLDTQGVDVVLVGDSLGMVIQGVANTIPVTMQDMLYHSRCVAAQIDRALLMVDMPFMSYHNPEVALENAGRLMQEGGAQMVKLEGGATQVTTVRRLSAQGIPVCAHLGLQPQSVHKMGGYRVQGRDQSAAQAMLDDALLLQDAGADVMVLECIPEPLASQITQALEIPVIGIGAGPNCDGQVLVLYDILGISVGKIPKFAHNFLTDTGSIEAAVAAYAEAVRSATFPEPKHWF